MFLCLVSIQFEMVEKVEDRKQNTAQTSSHVYQSLLVILKYGCKYMIIYKLCIMNNSKTLTGNKIVKTLP